MKHQSKTIREEKTEERRREGRERIERGRET
jgi:hypothetical protein